MKRTFVMVVLAFIGGTTYAQQQPRQASLAQQKMCAEQARKFVLDPEKDHKDWGEWSSHYEPKQNVCMS